MEQSVTTRLGDGSLVRMTPSEIRADLEEATALGARKAKVSPLEPDELDHLGEIFASNAKFTAVDIGDELVLSCDGSGNADSGTRSDELYSFQSHLGADIIELWNSDYSYKAIKAILSFEAQIMKTAQLNLVAPLQYGAMPDLGSYSQPDGPVPNWSELMPLGRIAEGLKSAYDAIITPAGLAPLKVFLECGRVVTGPYGWLVSRVIHIKDTYRKYVGLDASMADLMRRSSRAASSSRSSV